MYKKFQKGGIMTKIYKALTGTTIPVVGAYGYSNSAKTAMNKAIRELGSGVPLTVYEITVTPVKTVKFKTIVENVKTKKKTKKV